MAEELGFSKEDVDTAFRQIGGMSYSEAYAFFGNTAKSSEHLATARVIENELNDRPSHPLTSILEGFSSATNRSTHRKTSVKRKVEDFVIKRERES